MMIMGTLNSYLKGLSLRYKAQERMRDPTMAKGNTSSLRELQKQDRNKQLNAITVKLKSGQKLSGQEMEYLRRYSPALYEKAVKIRQERDQYRESLRKSRTKEDAEQKKAQKLQELSTELQAAIDAKDTGKAEMIQMRMNAISNEHSEFVQSKAYAELPTEQELREKKKGKKKSGISSVSSQAVRFDLSNRQKAEKGQGSWLQDQLEAKIEASRKEGTRPTTEPVSDPRLPSERKAGASRPMPSGAAPADSTPVSDGVSAAGTSPAPVKASAPSGMSAKSFSIKA